MGGGSENLSGGGGSEGRIAFVFQGIFLEFYNVNLIN